MVDEASLVRARADRRLTVYEQVRGCTTCIACDEWPIARLMGAAWCQVCEEVWRYAQPYRLVDPTDPFRFKTVWFVMDELGVRETHTHTCSTCLLRLAQRIECLCV